MDAGFEADRIVSQLRAIRPEPMDPPALLPTSLPFYGVPVGDLRRVARTWHREHPDASVAFVAAVADALWSRAVREDMVVAAMIHGRSPATRSVFSLDRADRWGPNLDMWETTDQLGMNLAGPWIADGLADRLDAMAVLASRDNPWLRRLAMVCGAHLGRLPEVAFDPIEDLVLRLCGDRAAAIPKAISWVLRSHLKFRADEVLAFIDGNADVLPAVAVRETRKRAATGRKN